MAESAYSTDHESALHRQVSLCELLDRVLNKGAVLTGEITISVANIELIYVGLGLVISSVEKLLDAWEKEGQGEKERQGEKGQNENP
jgi:hypothetical protein